MDREFEKEVLERLARIETKLDDYDNIKTKVEEARAKAYSNEARIDKIEDNTKWLSRTVVGALITGGIAIIFIVVKLGLGIN